MKVIYWMSLVGVMMLGCSSNKTSTDKACSTYTKQSDCLQATYAGTGCVWGGSKCFSNFSTCADMTDLTNICGNYPVSAGGACYSNGTACVAAAACSDIKTAGFCGMAVYNNVGCTWNDTSDTCTQITKCDNAASQAACTMGTPGDCTWVNNACTDPTQPQVAPNPSSGTTTPACSTLITQDTCLAGYEGAKKPCKWASGACSVGTCADASGEKICKDTALNCTWTAGDPVCQVKTPLKCENIRSTYCCPAGTPYNKCTKTDPNCNAIPGYIYGATCSDNLPAFSTPNSSGTACCSGTDTTCTENGAGCSFTPGTCS